MDANDRLMTLGELIRTVDGSLLDNTLQGMFFGMVGQPRAYMEWHDINHEHAVRLVYQNWMFGCAEELTPDVESRLCHRMLREFRKRRVQLPPDDQPLLFWRMSERIAIRTERDFATKQWHSTIRTRVFIPGTIGTGLDEGDEMEMLS